MKSLQQHVRTLLPLLTLCAVLFTIAAQSYFVESVRGSDQYWYLADTEMLASDQPPFTNTVFPGDVLRAGTADIDTYFAHNGPLLHINAFIADYIGAVSTWRYTNLLYFLLAALFTGLTLASLTSSSWGYLAALVYLLTPINVWLAGNFLQETFFGLLSAVVFYAFVTESGAVAKRILLIIALALGALSHPLYVIVGVFYGLYGLVVRRAWVASLLVFGVVLFAIGIKDVWFPTSFPPSIKDLVSASVPGFANTIWQLSDTVPAINLDFLVSKLTHALKIQFLPSAVSPLYLVTNLGLISLLVLFFKSAHQKAGLLYMSAIFMLSYGGMIVLVQNQMRYQLFITPVAITCTLYWMSSWHWLKLRGGLLVALLVMYCVIDLRMWQRIKADSHSSRQGVVVFERAFEFIEEDARVAVLGNTLGGWLSVNYSLRPTRVLTVYRVLLSDSSFERVMELYNADYVFTMEGHPVDELAGLSYVKTIENPDLFNVEIYRRDIVDSKID